MIHCFEWAVVYTFKWTVVYEFNIQLGRISWKGVVCESPGLFHSLGDNLSPLGEIVMDVNIDPHAAQPCHTQRRWIEVCTCVRWKRDGEAKIEYPEKEAKSEAKCKIWSKYARFRRSHHGKTLFRLFFSQNLLSFSVYKVDFSHHEDRLH